MKKPLRRQALSSPTKKPRETHQKLTSGSFGGLVLDDTDFMDITSLLKDGEELLLCHVARNLADEKLDGADGDSSIFTIHLQQGLCREQTLIYSEI